MECNNEIAIRKTISENYIFWVSWVFKMQKNRKVWRNQWKMFGNRSKINSVPCVELNPKCMVSNQWSFLSVLQNIVLFHELALLKVSEQQNLRTNLQKPFFPWFSNKLYVYLWILSICAVQKTVSISGIKFTEISYNFEILGESDVLYLLDISVKNFYYQL